MSTRSITRGVQIVCETIIAFAYSAVGIPPTPTMPRSRGS